MSIQSKISKPAKNLATSFSAREIANQLGMLGKDFVMDYL